MKTVELREITPQNFFECINLNVAEAQNKFVAPNVLSIAQCVIYPTAKPVAVYAEGEMVGFARFGFDDDDGRYYLGRLMIDERQQGKGYGRAATLAVIEALKQNKGCREIYLCCSPENTRAEKLYESIGFERTGETYGDEIVMRFVIENNENPQSAIQN